ncbi:MAG: peptide chain release factor N(5)-glutamine methyltransferase [Acidobacteria bacterium]|nr:peptide chain release factor N(5)-glutamine methyltransferase [Acidobacteriota bacterium]
MHLKNALKQGVEVLEKAGVPSSRLTAEVLLMHAARCDRAYLYAHPERELSEVEWIHYGRYLNERLAGKPTQYITGHQEFWGLDFLVNSSVLIPRPETELVVEATLELVRLHFLESAKCNIADVGSGSGCIAMALARELPYAKIFALDRSSAALETARTNAQRLGVEQRIEFLLSDLLAPCSGKKLPPLEIVVSNPPYVAQQDRRNVMPEVRNFEPAEAVFAGESGGEVYARLIPQAAQALSPGGFLVLELGYDSQEKVNSLLPSSEWEEVRWWPDLAGVVRVVTARWG